MIMSRNSLTTTASSIDARNLPESTPLPPPLLHRRYQIRRLKRSSAVKGRKALLKLKAKYRQEIDQWVHLSNTLKIMKQKSRIIIYQQQKSPEPSDNTTSSLDQVTTTTPVAPAQSSSDSSCSQILDELLLQTEAQEWIIEDAARLCDAADALCSAREESFKKSFTELPIWASNPHELMTSLYQD